MSNWISVNYNMPEQNVDVWVHGSGGVTIGQFWGRLWFDVYGDNDGMRDDTIYDVTHWMPMDVPLPP